MRISVEMKGSILRLFVERQLMPEFRLFYLFGLLLVSLETAAFQTIVYSGGHREEL